MLHHAIIFNKVTNLYTKEYDELKKDAVDILRIEKFIDSQQALLFKNMDQLDPFQTLITLR
jgi:hypothetical protein